MTYRHSRADSHPSPLRAGGLSARTYNGVILLDRTGNAQGHNAGLEQLVDWSGQSNGGKHLGHDWQAMFPAGCRPADLIARENPEEPTKTVLFSGEGGSIPVELRLEALGENWLLFVSACEKSASPLPSNIGHLDEQQSTREMIGSYLHDTVCQNLVGVSMLLAKVARDPATAGSPALLKAGQVSETCARQIRALMKILSSPAVYSNDPPPDSTSDSPRQTLAGIRDYLSDLKSESGLNISLETDFERLPEMGSAELLVLAAAAQRWAEGTLGARASREALTRIGIASEGKGAVVEFASDLADDPAIAGLAASHAIRLCLQESGGDIEWTGNETGSSVRIWLGREHRPVSAAPQHGQEI